MKRNVSKVTRNYQLTIPLEIREFLGIKEGEYVEFEIDDGKVVIKPLRKKWSTVKLRKQVSVEEIEEIANSAFENDSS
ncbi:MAG: AbrB/MazE/SpoVT family DNA-binding domain-containing protein [Saccharolobus sp.]|uniref:SpoVT-AbrB domain-containing protein n=2 Tax=Saccharolobus shibatae TaxID=2286 RepID=A0A8F5BUM5_9CREN|nr:AbrB/MazE/SpoVT family DNA-binding domain-containing protein [Saccharolobus shibatae]MCH4816686.1 AbrB/MazE/SpoVT family DNA-binding domain-containing protein [Saccharolobus shibatae]QXJ28474.1 hypothetical protein J5U23_01343 [Saccharolobus shibatae B12]QXJ31803.1 hypothetical protein J5U21_01454 [Saccharolobus shibatae]QXJ34826.1 hypothetical protein J5U22_01373 [Saccharolobus shibatae]